MQLSRSVARRGLLLALVGDLDDAEIDYVRAQICPPPSHTIKISTLAGEHLTIEVQDGAIPTLGSVAEQARVTFGVIPQLFVKDHADCMRTDADLAAILQESEGRTTQLFAVPDTVFEIIDDGEIYTTCNYRSDTTRWPPHLRTAQKFAGEAWPGSRSTCLFEKEVADEDRGFGWQGWEPTNGDTGRIIHKWEEGGTEAWNRAWTMGPGVTILLLEVSPERYVVINKTGVRPVGSDDRPMARTTSAQASARADLELWTSGAMDREW